MTTVSDLHIYAIRTRRHLFIYKSLLKIYKERYINLYWKLTMCQSVNKADLILALTELNHLGKGNRHKTDNHANNYYHCD